MGNPVSRCTYVFVLLHDIHVMVDVKVSYIFYITVVAVSNASLSYILGLQLHTTYLLEYFDWRSALVNTAEPSLL